MPHPRMRVLGWTVSPAEIAALILLLILTVHLFAPQTVNAVQSLFTPSLTGEELRLTVEAMENATRPFGTLPQAENGSPAKVLTIPVTAYSSEPWQTDSTPFITASGTTVRHGVVAANFVPIGTLVRFPELYGDQVFVVEDRMNARYNQRVDIWMEETADARNFGLKWTTVEVF